MAHLMKAPPPTAALLDAAIPTPGANDRSEMLIRSYGMKAAPVSFRARRPCGSSTVWFDAMSNPLEVRRLAVDDAPAFIALRREALEDTPMAFSSSLEDDPKLSVERIASWLAEEDRQAIFGAFLFRGETALPTALSASSEASRAPTGIRLVGAAGLARHANLKERHKGLIWGVYVSPVARRRGAGRALIDAAVAQARAWGLERVQLSVSETTPGARRLYEAVGFKPWGIERRAIHWRGRFADEMHMALEL